MSPFQWNIPLRARSLSKIQAKLLEELTYGGPRHFKAMSNQPQLEPTRQENPYDDHLRPTPHPILVRVDLGFRTAGGPIRGCMVQEKLANRLPYDVFAVAEILSQAGHQRSVRFQSLGNRSDLIRENLHDRHCKRRTDTRRI